MATELENLIQEAKFILSDLGYSRGKVVPMSAALTLLALANMKPGKPWSKASNDHLGIHSGIFPRIEKLGKKYAENSRETIRKQGLNAFLAMDLVAKNPGDPSLPQNSAKTHYALTKDALSALMRYGMPDWKKHVTRLSKGNVDVDGLGARRRRRKGTSLTCADGQVFQLSPGRHSELIAAIVEDFLPNFMAKAELLYLSDTSERELMLDKSAFQNLGVAIDSSNKLPDVIVYDPITNCLVLIEAVDSGGAITDHRKVELEKLFGYGTCKLAFITVFESFNAMRKYLGKMAWDTDIWVVEEPNHLIHFNGSKFITRQG